ncbi:MAG: alanine racemase [Actinomycetes bacterium]
MSPELRAQARVDLDAIAHNVRVLGEHARGAQVLAVVKGDGYGHGLVPSAQAALTGGAGWLGVAFVEEALALRASGVAAPILCWLAVPGEPLQSAVEADVDLSASEVWALEEIRRAAQAADRPARVHLKADTGLHRGGATAVRWPDLVEAAAKAEASGEIRVVGVWSHLAHADAPDHPTTAKQEALYLQALEVAAQAGLHPDVRHLANSAATLTRPSAHFDLVRPGLAVYGLTPVPQHGGPERYDLRPAMTLTARVALVKEAPAGSGVSYGHRYVTETATSLALVPLGYADGIPRAATNTVEVMLAGRRRRIAGTVCMDQFVLDVGSDDVNAGDEVLLFGPGDAGEPTAQEWADALGTISYEIVTRLGPRLPRTYVGGRS